MYSSKKFKSIIVCVLFLFLISEISLIAKTRALEISQLDEISILSSLDINTSFRLDPTYLKMKNNIDQIKTLYFLKALKKGSIFMPNLHQLLGESDIPDTFLYMAMVESKFVAGVKSKRNAAGLWQLMPSTAKEFNLEISKSIDERLDPIKSTKAAIQYLKYLHKRFGKWYLATLAYNCGETKLAKVLREVPNDDLSTLIDDKLKYLPTETRNYMRRIVIAAMLAYDNEIILKNDADHLFGNCTNSKLIEVFFNGGSTLSSIAKKVGISLDKIKNCNPHLLKEKVPDDKKSYHVYLPEEFVKDLNSSEITIGRFTYKVKDGDTVSKISKKFNIKISTIRKLNPSIKTILNIGQNITLIGENKVINLDKKRKHKSKKEKKISAKKDINNSDSIHMKFTYIVQDGDSISKISKKFNIKTSVIQELNPKIKTILAIGQKLTLIKDKPEFPYITKKLKELQGK